MTSEPKQVIASKLPTLFGDRIIVFVKYPPTWTAQEMVDQLNWAKTWTVHTLYYDEVIIRCHVKEHYMEDFRRDNDKYIVKHALLTYKDDDGDDVYVFDVEDTLYDFR
jgi:hypothetical protein